MSDDQPTVLNPEAIGDPNQTPIVRLPAWMREDTATDKGGNRDE